MKSFLFRCDSSSSLGSGHVSRCLNMADQLSLLGGKIIFACRTFNTSIINKIEEKYQVIRLPISFCNKDGKEQDDSDLTAIDNKVVATDSCQIMDSNGLINELIQLQTSSLDWLIIDHYSFDYVWHRNFRRQYKSHFKKDIQLLALEDLANKSIEVDAVLDQNYYGSETYSRYSGLLKQDCVQLYGPQYALLGKEYFNKTIYKSNSKRLSKCLVFFGGSDQFQMTQKAIEAIASPEFSSIEFKLIIGIQNRDKDSIIDLCAHKNNITVCPPVHSLYEMIKNSDFALTGGITTWERACLDLPSIVVSLSTNQYEGSKKLGDEGYIYFLGKQQNVSPKQISKAISDLVSKRVSLNPTNLLTDSFGALKLAHFLYDSNNPLIIEKVTKKYSSTLFSWANDPDVRQNSFTPDLIKPQDHIEWFENSLLDQNRIHYIGLDSLTLCPVGQIRFDLNILDECADIDISVDRVFRGRGYSLQLLKLGIQHAHRTWGNTVSIRALVLDSNLISKSLFLQYGFEESKKDENATYSTLMYNK